MNNLHVLIILSLCFLGSQMACSNGQGLELHSDNLDTIIEPIKAGALQTSLYFPRLEGKNVGLTVNQTSMIGETHLVDSLLTAGFKLSKVFAPEHGFRGNADAGEHIDNTVDERTGLPIISVYGNQRKPNPEDLKDIDIMIFDIQDVGVRFYTYTSTMHYMMEACAENDIPLIILDRPNPNGYYVDGPVLDLAMKSFIGMHEVPVVYGMSIGEYAKMLKGEAWIAHAEKLNLTVIPCLNYDHTMTYDLPIKPSPNLPNLRSILLYPSLCFFEGTHVSVGRGTDKQFQIIGHPDLKKLTFPFVPEPKPGAKKPKQEGKVCYGRDFTEYATEEIFKQKQINLEPLLSVYRMLGDDMFLDNNFFDKLAGSPKLKQQILSGDSAEEIRATWQEKLEIFKRIRKGYLLYPDFY